MDHGSELLRIQRKISGKSVEFCARGWEGLGLGLRV